MTGGLLFVLGLALWTFLLGMLVLVENAGVEMHQRRDDEDGDR